MRTLTYILAIAVVIAGLVGCEKYTSGYDTNPLAPQSANAAKTFVGAELAYVEFTEGTLSWVASMWADQLHGGQRQFAGYDVYTGPGAGDIANDWALAYEDVLKNLRLVESNTAVSQKLKGGAEVLEGVHMGNVAAMWGDVPYSEAVKGLANTTPHYDAQQSVYTQVQAILSQGITDLTATASGTFEDALSYNGSGAKWVKLGHSAKARYFMHMARGLGNVTTYDATTLASVITEANQGILATTGADDFMFLHSTGAYNGDMNLWYSFGVNDRAGYMDAEGSFAVSMLQNRHWDGKTSETKRLAYYFDLTVSPVDLNYADGAYTATSSYPGFRASETHLLLAEAYARQGNSASALTELNNARTYNNTVYGDASAPYVAGDFPTVAALLQGILNEEYLAVMHQMEAFSLVRRIDYVINYKDSAGTVHALAPKQGTKFPYRFLYSVDEFTANPNKPVEAVGVLDQFTRPWADH